MPDDASAKIRIQENSPSDWQPKLGSELQRLLDSSALPPDRSVRESIERSTLAILQRCLNPNDPNDVSKTGLVVGYVQSGKTLSFTAVTAAAHDNGYRAVVLLAGSKLNLAGQNRDRLAKDLAVHQDFTRPWVRVHNPTTDNVDSLRASLAGWQYGQGQSLLLTALKHQSHVRNLGDVLESLGEEAQPVLIIDDEADQISLNTKVSDDDRSPNYAQILSLRDKVRRHTYLGYTATPQALVFIPLWDQLSPDFCELLQPGADYSGGSVFFVERKDELVRQIPDEDLELAEELQECPPSLTAALRLFYLGVVQGICEWHDPDQPDAPKNRSMMIHPSVAQVSHEFFSRCIRNTRDAWIRILREPTEDPDRQLLIESFRQSYNDLSVTDRAKRLYPFEDLEPRLLEWIGRTQIAEVNSRPGVPTRDWSTEWGTQYSWILVGGNNLDRGFTVEGLTVTYMPRSIGGGQADTLQQRARFFGYKAKYLDVCRVYLGRDALSGFTKYVRHESSMRSFLERNKDALKDPSIPRQFQLDSQLIPTRRSVLKDVPKRRVLRSGWLIQRGIGVREQRCYRNGEILREFTDTLSGVTDETAWPWFKEEAEILDAHRHRVFEEVPLRTLYEAVLSEIVLPDFDEHLRWQVALDMIFSAVQENPGLVARVVAMRPDVNPFRGLEDRDIKQVAAGAYPSRPPYTYLGDRSVHLCDATLQLHHLDLGIGADAESSSGRDVQYRRVPIVALWLGDHINASYVQQDQSHR